MESPISDVVAGLVGVSWETPRTTSVEVEAREPSGKGFLGNSPDLYFVHCHTVKKEWKVKIDVLRRVVGSWFRRSGKRMWWNGCFRPRVGSGAGSA